MKHVSTARDDQADQIVPRKVGACYVPAVPDVGHARTPSCERLRTVLVHRPHLQILGKRVENRRTKRAVHRAEPAFADHRHSHFFPLARSLDFRAAIPGLDNAASSDRQLFQENSALPVMGRRVQQREKVRRAAGRQGSRSRRAIRQGGFVLDIVRVMALEAGAGNEVVVPKHAGAAVEQKHQKHGHAANGRPFHLSHP